MYISKMGALSCIQQPMYECCNCRHNYNCSSYALIKAVVTKRFNKKMEKALNGGDKKLLLPAPEADAKAEDDYAL
jgi:hypothetical protein